MAVVVLGFPLVAFYEYLYIYKQPVGPTLINTVTNNALFLLVCVLLGNNRLRALISVSFIFSIIFLAQIPVLNFYIAFVYPEADVQSFLETSFQLPKIYYSCVFFIVIIITVCCLLAAHWLRGSKLKPPLKLYISFNLLFVFFTLIILVWFKDSLMGLSISFLSNAFLGTLFIGILLFLFFLYTLLTKENLTAGLTETESPLSLKAEKGDKYTPFIQLLSRRELEVIEAVLAGNVRHKQLSAALNISVSTVKTHLIHIYQTTGVSSIAALSSLFHGYTPPAPKNQP